MYIHGYNWGTQTRCSIIFIKKSLRCSAYLQLLSLKKNYIRYIRLRQVYHKNPINPSNLKNQYIIRIEKISRSPISKGFNK